MLQGNHDLQIGPVEQSGDCFMVPFSWVDRDGARHPWAHVLTVREDKIHDMQDHDSWAKARRAL